MIGAAIAVPGQHIVIIADHTTACALRVDKIVWQTPRISLNGIHLVSATANRITGSARGYGEAEDGWEPVELDAVYGEVLRSPLCKNRSLE